MVRQYASVLLLTALVLIVTSPRSEPVVLAVPLSLQPYFIPVSDKGLAYETIRAAFGTQGLDVQSIFISPKNYTRALAGDRRIDCAGLLTESETSGWYAVDDIYSFHDYAVTLRARGIELNQVEDLGSKSIIAFPEAREKLGPAFRAAVIDNPRYRELGNHRARVKLLIRNRVDVIIGDKLLTDWYLKYLSKETGSPVDVIFHDLFPPQQLKFACRRREMTEAFADGIKRIRVNGTMEEIQSIYMQ